jgi:tetratricopeptide (TPR) repeat protein
VLRQLGRPEAARAHLQRAVAVDPAYADAIYNLAALDYEMGNLDEAVAGWRRYLELDDSSDWARRARSGITLVSQMPRSQAG